MAARRKVANPLALAVLAELLLGPLHPYEIGRRLEQHRKDRTIKYTRSSLYMVVEQLTRAGFIAEQETVRDTARPERTLYAVNGEGRAELYDWLRELVSEPAQEYPQFGVALSLLSVIAPAEAAELLTLRLASLTAEIQEIRTAVREAADGGVIWIFLVEDDYRLALLEAECRFVTGLIDSLRGPEYERAWHEFFGSPK
jgi:DNA-binding PadR family transcriptional regulator